MRRWLTVLKRVATRVGVLATVPWMLALAIDFGLSVPADATDHPVNSESNLRTAITGAADGDTITFNVDVTLTADLPAIQTNVTILGNDKILDGAGTYRGFFVVKFVGMLNAPVTVTIQDLTIQNALARGGAGQDNAGGGAGLGGALFVANLATVTLSNVQLDTNSARGGLGGVDGIFGGGGGGGLGGFGGANNGGGGGGVGVGASGGNGTVGQDGSAGIMVGLASGGKGAGSGFGVGGSSGGGGGGGAAVSGTTYGGGGGGGVAGFPAPINGQGGGNGGFGGGGGGAGDAGGDGGMGGYGGGGGAIAFAGGSLTGLGGFGGGGAGGASGGFGGGNGAVSIGFPGGGGGAGLGGALFAQEGGSLTLAGPLAINGSSVTGGAVRDANATPGSAFGSGIFLQGNGQPLTSTPGAGETQTIADDIADQAGSGSTGIRGLTKSGAGTLTLSGTNTYSGATTVSTGTLLVDGSIISPVTVNSGGTLGGTGTVGNTVTVTSGGAIAPGNSPGILNTGTLTLNSGSTLDVEINGTTVGTQYDQVNVTGGVTLGNATLNVVLGFTPSAGQTFTIIANDLSDPVGGTFSGLPEGSIFTAGDGRFRVSYVGGSGNDVVLTALSVPPTIDKAFDALAIMVNTPTTLTFTLTNPDAGTALTGVAFADSFPAGLEVAATPSAMTTGCGSPTFAPMAGDTSVSFSGGTIAASGTCTVTVDVTATTGGLKANTTSAVTSSEGGTGGTAMAFLVVVAPPEVAPPTIVKAFGAASIDVDETTTLTFTLTNPNPMNELTGIGFTDTLPAGLVVANPNDLVGACGGTVTAVAGTGSVDLANGDLPANASCTITLNVTGITAGAKDNITNAVTSVEGGTGGTASASLEVVAPTATPTATVTNTPTRTSTATTTPTPAAPAINTPVEPGDASVTGSGTPNCAKVYVCLIGGGGMTPSMPSCTAPDTVLGMGPVLPNGNFNISIPPLMANQCIYAFDTCAMLTSPVVCAREPAPAPALSPHALALAVGVLSLIALIGLSRVRRRT